MFSAGSETKLRGETVTLKVLQQKLAVCKLSDLSQIDYTDEYLFIGKTDEEISLVCSLDKIPENTLESDITWCAFRIQGQLDFSLIGILSQISTLLADNQIGIFAISTYNTDYILTKEETFRRALEVLVGAGYEVVE
jgi:hypothetical protein